MRVTIYNEPAGGGLGGSEYCAAVLAAAFSEGHEVRLVHHRHDLDAETAKVCFGEDLSGVELCCLPANDDWLCQDENWWSGGKARRQWKSVVSDGADCVIPICHGVPPFCGAELGILYVLFPLFDRRREWPWATTGAGLRQHLRRAYYDRDWRARLKSYRHIVSISDYTRRWTQKMWGCNSSVIYPPVDTQFPMEAKQDVVVAVGRFCEMKRQKEMLATFCRMAASGACGWRLDCCGNASDEAYYRTLCVAADGLPINLVVGADRSEIKQRLARSKIFWHAAGYGMDEMRCPAKLEHFGIATVEAMAAGCVPIVPNKGGQPEIVEHGVNGFLWTELEELPEFTRQLMLDDDLRQSMADAAARRAQAFCKQRFISEFRTLVNCFEPALAV